MIAYKSGHLAAIRAYMERSKGSYCAGVLEFATDMMEKPLPVAK
jgi:hypothetical protein